jgi:hypothetical protein
LVPPEFVVDVGEVIVIGPHRFAERTCVAGQTCRVDALTGQHLRADDVWVVLVRRQRSEQQQHVVLHKWAGRAL